MIAPYVAIMRLPHAARLMTSTAVYGIAATSTLLPLIFFAREATGSFSGASAVLAGDAIGNAIGAPVRGRTVDRHGARRTIPLFALALIVLIAALLAAGHAGAGLFVLVPLAFLIGGVSQTPGVVLRAIWSRVTAGHERSTAFALLTVMHELTNLSGPLIGALLLLLLSPTAALAGGAAVAALAMLWFAYAPGVDVGERTAPRALFSLGPLAGQGFRALLLVTLCYGVGFGAMEDIVLPAFAVEHGSRSSAGFFAAAIALGIAIGGFGYGLRRWRHAPGQLMPMLGLLALAGLLPALLADSIVAMTGAMLLFGLLVAPITTVQFAVVDDVVPDGSGAEAFSWYSSFGYVGAAIGAILAGKLVDSNGTRTAAAVAIAAVAFSVCVSLVRRRVLATRVSSRPLPEPTEA